MKRMKKFWSDTPKVGANCPIWYLATCSLEDRLYNLHPGGQITLGMSLSAIVVGVFVVPQNHHSWMLHLLKCRSSGKINLTPFSGEGVLHCVKKKKAHLYLFFCEILSLIIISTEKCTHVFRTLQYQLSCPLSPSLAQNSEGEYRGAFK